MINQENILAFAQINTICGDIEYNKNKVIEYIKKAKEKNVSFLIFPKNTLLSYPIGNIIEKFPYIINQHLLAIEEIKQYCDNIAILIGYIEKKDEKAIYNSMALLKNKKIDRIFKEFSIGNQVNTVELNGAKYTILMDKSLENIDIERLSFAANTDILIYPTNSFSTDKKEEKINNIMKDIAKIHNVKFAYINQVGANDGFVFDGASRLYDEKGEIIAFAKSFEQDLLVIDENKNIENLNSRLIEQNQKPKMYFSLDYEYDLERTYKAIILSIKDYFSKNGFKQAVLGLSGGLDSTVCAVLLADALGKENVYGISMPSKLTSDDSKSDAQELANNLGINFVEIPIKNCQEMFSNKFFGLFNEVQKYWTNRYQNSYTQDNIQARSRAMILWGVANEFGATIPIATSDKSETYMGYATINGDMSGGFSPISDVTKTKLFALARWMNKNREIKDVIPKNIIIKPPGAELALDPNTGKTLLAEDALMPYEFLDEVIWRIENLKQDMNDMIKETFLYENNHKLELDTKTQWLEKFFKRMNNALYKWYIAPPSPIIDNNSINKVLYNQPITSNINYKK